MGELTGIPEKLKILENLDIPCLLQLTEDETNVFEQLKLKIRYLDASKKSKTKHKTDNIGYAKRFS